MNSPCLTINSWELATNKAYQECVQPAVSVVITLYNYSAYIKGCLESVRATKAEGLPGGFEVVVVDDCSTDDSREVVEKYMASSELPLCLVKKQSNSGLADARNIGLLTARAPLVFILDADNEIRPECLQAHYQVMAGSDYAMVYGLINQFDHATRQSLATMSNYEWDVRSLISHPCIDAMAMIRKEIVLRVGGYSPEYGTILPQGWEDYDLCLKLAQAGYSGKLIPQILSDYRAHPDSMVHNTWPFQRELAAYFSRKFHSLVVLHPDTAQLFSVSRSGFSIANGQSVWLQCPTKNQPPKWIHRLLGKKLCRSICKRLTGIYCWLYP